MSTAFEFPLEYQTVTDLPAPPNHGTVAPYIIFSHAGGVVRNPIGEAVVVLSP